MLCASVNVFEGHMGVGVCCIARYL